MKIKFIVLSFCRRFSFYPSRLISKAKIVEIMRILKPIKNGYELVRIGPQSDGGYLVPNDFEGIDVCFSPGVADNWNFEKDLYKKTGISSIMFDGSVDAPSDLTNNHLFVKKFVGAASFNDYLSIHDIFKKELKDFREIIGQIDIEGGEYSLLSAISLEDLLKLRIIVVEFHEIDRWIQKRFYTDTLIPLFEKLFFTHDLVHFHVNRFGGSFRYKSLKIPKVVELTLHRKDRSKGNYGYSNIPHILDRDN
jgi:hypothetical protein